MKRLKGKRIKIALTILTLLCISFPYLHVNAENKEILRVGFYNEEGYHTINTGQKHIGYDYEYLMKISKYTGWKYEFVEGTWEECVSMLQKGEIDLLGGVDQSNDRLETIAFANQPSMYSSNCLLVELDNNEYTYNDFQSFNGIKIGALKGSVLINSLHRYAKEKNFTFELKVYDSETELNKALNTKEVDCVYLTDMRTLDNYKIIARFDYTSMYYALSKQKAYLKDELDSALEEIHTENHYYESHLYQKYFSSPTHIAFTPREQDFIENNSQIDIVIFDNYPIICEYNSKTQQYEGIIIDVLNHLSKKTDITFNYLKIDENQRWNYIKNHPNTLVAPTLINELVDFDNQIIILDTLIQGRMIAVSEQNHKIDLTKNFKLAISKNMTGAQEELIKRYPQVEIIFCNSHQERLNMVKKNQVDVALINEYIGNYLLQSPYYNHLNIINSEYIDEDISLSLSSSSNPLLISIMNKAIASFNERDISQIIIDNTMNHHYKLSINEWLYQNRIYLSLIILLTFLSLMIIYKYYRQKQKIKEEAQKLKIEKERHEADLVFQKKIFYQAHFDELTQLYNKHYFIEKANELLFQNPDIVYAFFRLNIEKFKVINEVYGKEKGDIVLIKIANHLRETIGQKGVYGRMYSDHFAICYPIQGNDLINISELSSDYIDCDGQKIRVQINIGIYINTKHYCDATQLLDYAQIALQNHEKTKNKHISYFKDSYLEHLIQTQEITNEMDNALKTNQFQVYYQPQYEINSRYLVGAEALIRWIHPIKGIMSPQDFIPIFENNDFIFTLDQYVLDIVCQQLQKWNTQGQIVPISINLSRIDLQHPELPYKIKSTIEKYQIPTEYIHFEITESVYAQNHEEFIKVIKNIQDMGFIVEIDDFGSGYSSLNILKDTPVDVIKLDLKFFSGETHMDKGGNIISFIVHLAQSLGMSVIAEGVETQREANFLKSIHCQYAQGYLYNKPMPLFEFEKLLNISPIGRKVFRSNHYDMSHDIYWKTEKFNSLMLLNHSMIFDYDPACDCALITFLNQNNRINEKTVHAYSKNILDNETIHPHDRLKIQEILLEHCFPNELTFLADKFKTGSYKHYHASIYYYYNQTKLNKIIAIIKEI